jgi:hypothetical protein
MRKELSEEEMNEEFEAWIERRYKLALEFEKKLGKGMGYFGIAKVTKREYEELKKKSLDELKEDWLVQIYVYRFQHASTQQSDHLALTKLVMIWKGLSVKEWDELNREAEKMIAEEEKKLRNELRTRGFATAR